ncbi:DUF2958 domain-containing protein [Kribbella sp. NPDC059898]|uniref:DUF2958 domain-containing protein n=1 Tax=Kribbella sp. NPDC059898 TaxID=3346995 RepID=UPI003658DC85
MSDYKMPRPPKDTPPLYAQDGKGYEATVYAHYFIGNCDWLITEYDPEEDRAFGWACVGDRDRAELGYLFLFELEQVRVRGVFLVDYEIGWQRVTLTEAIAELDRKQGWTR